MNISNVSSSFACPPDATMIYVGQNVTGTKYAFKLETISVPYGTTPSKASIKIFDATTGTYTGQTVQMSTNATQNVTIGSDNLTIMVCGILSGLTPLDSWAVMRATEQ